MRSLSRVALALAAGLSVLLLAAPPAVGTAGLRVPDAPPPPPGPAGGNPPDVPSARSASDAATGRYFAALDDYQVLGAQADQVRAQVATDEARVAQLRHVVQARAVAAYVHGGDVGLVALLHVQDLDTMIRGTKLLEELNRRDDSALGALRTRLADLRASRTRLEQLLADRHARLDSLQRARAAADAELRRALVDRADVLARLAAQAAQDAAARRAARAAVTLAERGGRATSPVGPVPTWLAGPAPVAVPVVPPAAPPAGGGSSHHDDPFLVCTRARESSGNYGAVSPSGYYGAYQFSPSTWNVTAQHAGRLDLVGVLPSSASVADQDTMAWTLYTWQGNGPWGGRC